MTQKLVFGFVGYAANLLSSLAPCLSAMVARSRQKIGAAALPNPQLLNHFRYTLAALIYNLIKKKSAYNENGPLYFERKYLFNLK